MVLLGAREGCGVMFALLRELWTEMLLVALVAAAIASKVVA